MEGDAMSGKKHVMKSSELRGKGRFSEAIKEIEDNLSEIDDITMVPALLVALYAAMDKGDTAKAKELAARLVKHDPDIPTVKVFLS